MLLDFGDCGFDDCKNEMQFKVKFIRELRNKKLYNVFFIETEETVQGFPDVMYINKKTQKVFFEEFKYTKNGKIKFQPTQPAFYKRYRELDISIIAYNAITNNVHCFQSSELFDKTSPYYINEKAEVDLRKADMQERF